MHRTIRRRRQPRARPTAAVNPLRGPSAPLRPLRGDRRGRPCGKLLSASRKAGRSSTEARTGFGNRSVVAANRRSRTQERGHEEGACNRGGVHTRAFTFAGIRVHDPRKHCSTSPKYPTGKDRGEQNGGYSVSSRHRVTAPRGRCTQRAALGEQDGAGRAPAAGVLRPLGGLRRPRRAVNSRAEGGHLSDAEFQARWQLSRAMRAGRWRRETRHALRPQDGTSSPEAGSPVGNVKIGMQAIPDGEIGSDHQYAPLRKTDASAKSGVGTRWRDGKRREWSWAGRGRSRRCERQFGGAETG